MIEQVSAPSTLAKEDAGAGGKQRQGFATGYAKSGEVIVREIRGEERRE
jgi:hypothetical protein